MLIYSKNIYTPEEIVDGYIEIEGEKIKKIYKKEEFEKLGKKTDDFEKFKDYENYYVIPGFVDNHIHGWGTGSFAKDGNKEAMLRMKRDLVKEGTTSFLGTTGTESVDRIKNTLKEAKTVLDNEKNIDGAEMVGIHLEGPFISEEFKGMMKAEYCKKPDVNILEEFSNIVGIENIKLMTMAPELPDVDKVMEYCNKNDIVVQAGHTAATFGDMKKGIELGIKGVTHTYSGMKGFHHRELGVVGSVMYFDELYAEFAKQTGLTVKSEAFDIMFRLKGIDKMLLTTDAVGLSRGEEEFYHYIRKARFIPNGDEIKVVYDDGKIEIKNRLNYDEIKDLELGFLGSVQNILKRGVYSLAEVVKMSSHNPAKYIGIDDKKGDIEEGKDADIVILDRNYNLKNTICRGKIEY